jgi:putative endonuclease
MKKHSAKSEIAIKGEELAASYLSERGYKIIERNWRFSRLGEIDIIAQKQNTLVFVEVKTRTSRACGDPLESITPSKQRQIAKLVNVYMLQKPVYNHLLQRVDAISVILKNSPEVEHLKNAFECDF